MPRLIAAITAAALLLVGTSAAQEPTKKSPKKEAAKEVSKPVKQSAKDSAKKKDAEGTRKKADAKKPADKKADQKTDKKDDGIGIKTRDASNSEIEIPEGANEEDIRAIRGANAMLETEKKLAAVLKKMKIASDTPFIKFDDLDSWPYEDGYEGMPEALRKYDGKKVAMAGFMLPIDEVEDIKTFYLVKSLWSCCFGIPPDVNGLVKINVKAKKGVGYQWDPILIVGTFRLKKVMDEDYTVCIWQIDDAEVRVIDVD